ncbi:MAG: DUF932 domain-containing protein [Candidatus Doudnabacteria bacterium]|nr:DUF932 domain-containing protein [Candidatus Doudnabacteria bacterium]
MAQLITACIDKQKREKPMLQGKTLKDLATQLMQIDETKRDLVVDLPLLSMNNKAELEVKNGSTYTFNPTTWTHQQLASYADIPKEYYDRIKTQNPELLSNNVNHAFNMFNKQSQTTGKKEARLLRTLNTPQGPICRALLSSRYRILDSSDLLTTALPLMIDMKMQIKSCELTEKRLYIKATSQKLTTEIKSGDTVEYGLVISSSDVGAGSVRVEPFLFRLVCTNGLISPDSTVRKFHIGKDLASIEATFQEILSDDTKALNDKAFWATVHDVIKNSMRQEVFESVVDRLRLAANEPIKNPKLDRVIDLTAQSIKVTNKTIKDQVLTELINGHDLSRWGLINAFTAAAHTTPNIDYDTSTELERASGKILELSNDQWRTIAAV